MEKPALQKAETEWNTEENARCHEGDPVGHDGGPLVVLPGHFRRHGNVGYLKKGIGRRAENEDRHDITKARHGRGKGRHGKEEKKEDGQGDRA